MQLDIHSPKCFDDFAWMLRWLGVKRYMYLGS